MLTRRTAVLTVALAVAVAVIHQFHTGIRRLSLNITLRSAIKRSDAAETKRLLAAGANPNARGYLQDFISPLTLAFYDADFEIAQALVDAGADLCAQDRLVIWAREGRVDVVRFLLRNGAKVDSKDSEGNTALAAASEYKQAAMVRFLKAQGARH
jgi:ankyrin repeat protein